MEKQFLCLWWGEYGERARVEPLSFFTDQNGYSAFDQHYLAEHCKVGESHTPEDEVHHLVTRLPDGFSFYNALAQRVKLRDVPGLKVELSNVFDYVSIGLPTPERNVHRAWGYVEKGHQQYEVYHIVRKGEVRVVGRAATREEAVALALDQEVQLMGITWNTLNC
jgi:hypothetical protein